MKKLVTKSQSPVVHCRVCRRDLVRSQGMWAHAEVVTHNGHLADPSPSDLRKFRDWAKQWAQ